MDRHEGHEPLLVGAGLLGGHRGDQLADALVPQPLDEARAGDGAGGLVVGQARDRTRGGEVLAVGHGHDHGHGRAGRQADDVAPVGIDRERVLDFRQDAAQIAGLAAVLVLVLLEPEAPTVLGPLLERRPARDEREHGDEAFLVDELHEARVVDHVLLGLAAAVQHHDHRHGRTLVEAVRHGDGVVAHQGAGLARRRQGVLRSGSRPTRCPSGPAQVSAITALAARAMRSMSVIPRQRRANRRPARRPGREATARTGCIVTFAALRHDVCEFSHRALGAAVGFRQDRRKCKKPRAGRRCPGLRAAGGTEGRGVPPALTARAAA